MNCFYRSGTWVKISMIILVSIVFLSSSSNNNFNNMVEINKYKSRVFVNNEIPECFRDTILYFSKLKEREYNKEYEDIWNKLKKIINTSDGREVALDILSKIEESKHISKIIKYKVIKRKKLLYMMEKNIAKSTEYILKTISEAKHNKDKYQELRARIELAVLYNQIDSTDMSINIILEVLSENIENSVQEAYIKIYAYINLSSIYFDMGDIDSSKKCLSKIEEYKIGVEDIDYLEVNIIKKIIESRIAIYNGNLHFAEELLDEANNLNKLGNYDLDDKREIIYSVTSEEYKKILSDMALAEIYEYKGMSYEALDIYNNIVNNDIYENYYKVITTYKAIKLSKDIGEEVQEIEYKEKLIKLQSLHIDNAYVDYSNYIMEQHNNYNSLLMYSEKIKKIYLVIIESLTTIILLLPFLYHRIVKIIDIISYDSLTRVYSRRLLDNRYIKLLNKNISFYVVMFDIDNFKKINDTYGHSFGDLVLRDVARKVSSRLGKNNRMYRYGGEEFIILIESRKPNNVVELVEAIRKDIELMKWNFDVKVTASFGIAYSEDFGKSTIKGADEFLYIAKRSGKNKVVFRD